MRDRRGKLAVCSWPSLPASNREGPA